MDPPPAYADPPSPVPFSDEEYESSQPGGDDDEEEVSQETEDNEEDDEESGDDRDAEADDNTEEAGDEASSQRRPRPHRARPAAGRPPRDYRHLRLKSTPALSLLADPEVREIGRTASWSLSTAKPGNGVDQLRDSSLDTYWQSDGLQPHYINIQFPRRQTVCAIALYMDFNLDESYTPKRMKVLVGTTFHNLEEVRTVDVREPCGWCTIPLWRKWGEDVIDNVLDPNGGEAEDSAVAAGGGRAKVPLWRRKPMRTHLVQICILSMHQNGRDTHVRQVKIFGPRDYGNGSGNVIVGPHGLYRGLSSSVVGEGNVRGGPGGKGDGVAMMIGSGRLSVPAFQTVGMSQFSVIR